jgi:hypothetical protein
MHARGAREELAILLPNTMSHFLRDGRHVLPESGTALRPGLLARLSDVLDWVVALPMRPRVIDEVNALSEREMADLELIRSKLPGWFDDAPAAAPASDHRQQGNPAADCLNWAVPG